MTLGMRLQISRNGTAWSKLVQDWKDAGELVIKFLILKRGGNVYLLWFEFILGLNFIFLLFLGIVMYDNEFETVEKNLN